MKKWRLSYDSTHKPPARVNLENAGEWDEFVLMSRDGKRSLVHAERMDTNDLWLSIGDARVWVRDTKEGTVVSIERGSYSDARGSTEFEGQDGMLVLVNHEPEKTATKQRGKR